MKREPRKLTAREIEIIRMVAVGVRNREVAEHLGISIKTVETHRANIMNKLALRGTVDLVHYALREKLIKVQPER